MSNKPKLGPTPLAAAIAAILYPIQPALAQEQDQEQETDRVLEEVIVTATLREMSLQDVPQSITAFTTMDIERNNFQTMDDIVKALPSLTLASSQPGRNSLVFRGISTGSQEFYVDSLGAVYLDETPLTTISQQVSPRLIDIERVEALPGPQGTLFGSASTSGTLRVITNKPNHDGLSGQIFAGVGTTTGGDPSYDIAGHVNLPLIEDTLAVRLVAYYTQQGGWIDNVLGSAFAEPPAFGEKGGTNAPYVKDNWNEYEVDGGRVSALWDITEGWSATLALVAENSRTDGIYESDPSLGDFKVTRFHDEFRTDEWTNLALTLQGDLGFATLTSNTSVFDRDIVYEWDNMYYEQWKDSFYGFYYGYDLYNSEYLYGIIFNDQTQDRFAQEIRLTSQSDSRFQWMIGGFYEDVEDFWYYGADTPGLVDTRMWYYAQYLAYFYNGGGYGYYNYIQQYPLDPTTVGYAETLNRTKEQTAIFGEISYLLNDDWTVTFGGRWFDYQRFESRVLEFPAGLPPLGSFDTAGEVIAESDSDDVLWKFSTQYNLDENKMVYFLFSQGFRLGGQNSPRAAATGQVPAIFKSDSIDNYEIGIKSEWMNQRLLFNATVFLMQWHDYQENSSSGVGPWWLRGTVNAGEAEQKGVEINATFLATDNFSFQGSLSWYNPEFTEDFTFPSGQFLPKGTTMVRSPEWKAWAALDWTLPGAAFGNDLWFRYNISYSDESFNRLSNAIQRDPEGLIPSWTVSDFQAGIDFSNDMTLSLVVNNVFDEKAINWLSDFPNYASDWFGTEFNKNKRTYNRPRSYGINFRKSWR